MSKKKYFVVWEGKNPGIYNSWEECKIQIHGYPNAKYMGFKTDMDAEDAFAKSYFEFIANNNSKKTETRNSKNTIPILESISVDAACSGNPGKMEYRGVYTKTKEEIFHMGPFENGTNNIGEFLALVHGLALIKQKNISLPIYSDSKTAICWVKNKKSKTSISKNEKNDKLFELITRAERWLNDNEISTPILKWETSDWGEIPADFGRK